MSGGLKVSFSGTNLEDCEALAKRAGMKFFGTEQIIVLFDGAAPCMTMNTGEVLGFTAEFTIFDDRPPASQQGVFS